jgi:HD-like signal output (HDOD) protein
VRSLVFALQVFSQFEDQKIPGFSIEQLAAHCRMTGLLARKIAEAERCDIHLRDQCFLAGLLHDVGRLVLAKGVPDEYGQVLKAAQAAGEPVWQAELSAFGATHAEVGGYLLGLWGLPDLVVEAVTFHHRPDQNPQPGFSPAVAVHVANAFAHGQTAAPGRSDTLINLDHLARLGLAGRLEIWRSRCLDDAPSETTTSNH